MQRAVQTSPPSPKPALKFGWRRGDFCRESCVEAASKPRGRGAQCLRHRPSTPGKTSFQEGHKTARISRLGRGLGDARHRHTPSRVPPRGDCQSTNGGMEKEQSAHHLLDQVCPVVPVAQMSQFMTNNDARVGGGEFARAHEGSTIIGFQRPSRGHAHAADVARVTGLAPTDRAAFRLSIVSRSTGSRVAVSTGVQLRRRLRTCHTGRAEAADCHTGSSNQRTKMIGAQ